MPRRQYSPAAPLLPLPLLIILVPTIALVLLFCILYFSSHVLRPISVKRGWDSLNVLLVLFAVVCGIFARRNDDEPVVDEYNTSSYEKTTTRNSVMNDWIDDDRYYSTRPGRLKRNSSSYPDLRQESAEIGDNSRFRFFDDFDLSKYRSSESEGLNFRRHRREGSEIPEEPKEIPVDTFVLRPTTMKSPSMSPAPPPPPPPPPYARHQKQRRANRYVGHRQEAENSSDQCDTVLEEIKSPPPPPPPPSYAGHHKHRRANRSVGHRQKAENSGDQCDAGLEGIKSMPQGPPPSTPPPPPPPPVATVKTEQKHSKSGRKMSNARKEIKMAFASLYRETGRKKKLKRKNLSDDYSDHALEEPVYFTRPPPSTPPPPPPPPPPSVFHNLFRKGSKTKRVHSFTAPPPPPPPPPPPSVFHHLFKKGGKSKRVHSFSPPPPPPPPPPRPSKPKIQTRTPPPPSPSKAPPTRTPESSRRRPTGTTGRPPLPARTDQFYDETVHNGGQSPLIPMPPPPPLPPFDMPKPKFVIRGDYVRIRSTPSSRCSSPELDDLDVSSTNGTPYTVNPINGGDRVIGSSFCPSPDVNIKADTFIARLREGWRLEKMKSLKENRNLDGGSDPGPDSGPSMSW